MHDDESLGAHKYNINLLDLQLLPSTSDIDKDSLLDKLWTSSAHPSANV